MNRQIRVLVIEMCAICILGMVVHAQTGYDPHKAFDPMFDAGSKSGCRGSDGTPGPDYWQNRADYSLEAILDDSLNVISATVRITYTNNSPDALPYLWLALDQNQFSANSRSSKLSLSPPQFAGGFTIGSVEIEQKGGRSKGDYIVNDTRMQIRLPVPLRPGGDKLILIIKYSFPVAPQGLGRSGMLTTKNGTIYDIAQWYPRMEVYDDIAGWNVLPFLGPGEFYLEYGDFDYRVTVPADQIVVGSGSLVNPASVLTKKEIERLAKARSSDSTVSIRDLGNVLHAQAENVNKTMRTWHFRMKNSRDVVWASSKAFLWDAARINLPEGKRALAMAVYPEESAKDSTWKRCAQYVRQSVEIFSRDWYPYPYPEATAVGGPVGGMEYPGVIFGSWKASRKGMWIVANHEFGHEWFPMIVGSDERVHAWMDEGFNTFIDIYAAEEFNRGEFAPKRDNEYAPKGGNPAREIVPYLTSRESQPVISYADAIPGKYVHPLEYYKAALGLVLLREDIVGKDRFDYAWRNYIRQWAYKHPTPFDFFRAMNNGAGENLNWFWKGWFVENWKLDQSVKEVRYPDDDTLKGSLITIANNDQMVMPVTMRVKESNGHVGTVHLPVEIWETSGEHTLLFPSTRRIISVVLDPDERLPDIDQSNNTWPASR
ncbi:MAG: M1 family metallopeptidase [Bacteroidota bacterium]